MDGLRARGEIWAYPMRCGDTNTAMLFSYLNCEARVSAGSTAPADRGDCGALWVLLPEFEKLLRETLTAADCASGVASGTHRPEMLRATKPTCPRACETVPASGWDHFLCLRIRASLNRRRSLPVNITAAWRPTSEVTDAAKRR
jgi:hypothetical protein